MLESANKTPPRGAASVNPHMQGKSPLHGVCCIRRGILDVTGRVVHGALGPVGLTFSLEVLVATQLASTFLSRALGLIGDTFHVRDP